MSDGKKTISLLVGTNGLAGAMLAKDQTMFAERFRQARMMQYNIDRTEALRRLEPELWKAFSLRWNLAPPYPKGWGDEDALLAVQHKTRLLLIEFTAEEKKFSAAWLVSHGIDLPPGMTFENGELKGEVNIPAMK